jgi:hypothetical protein
LSTSSKSSSKLQTKPLRKNMPPSEYLGRF